LVLGTSLTAEYIFVTMQATAAVLIWLKLLFFLRTSGEFGWLVRLIVEVLADMRVFMLILGIAIFAFTDAFFTISRNQYTEFQIESSAGYQPYFDALTYTYLLTLGDFDQSTSASIQWIFFFAASLFNLIIMLNLLIAVISETHARVTEISDLLQYQELSNLISDFLFFDSENVSDEGKLVLMVFEKDAIDNLDDRTDLVDIWDEVTGLKSEIKIISKTLM
jgi:hypothetical protein